MVLQACILKTSLCIAVAEFSLQLFLLQDVDANASVSLLNESLDDQSALRPGDNITFQCTTIGSSILAWTAINYISGRIEFIVYNQIGTMHTPNMYTTAVLANAYTDGNGQSVIESYLNITVQSSIPSSTITCHNVGTGETRVLSFQSSNTPVLTSDSSVLCPGEYRNFSCEIRDSIILAWENDEYIGPHGNRLEFLSTEPVGTVKFSEINPGVFANLTENYIQNGIRVLKCVLNISEFSYHPDTVDVRVMCLNVGLATESSYGVTVNSRCDTTTIGDESSTNAVSIIATNTSESVGTVGSSNTPGEVEMGLGMIPIIISIVVVILVLCSLITIGAIICKKSNRIKWTSSTITV